MKRISILILALIISSCSSMESDADKVCENLEESKKMMPEILKLSFKSITDKSAAEELEEIQEKIEEMGKEIEDIVKKYEDDEKFKDYLRDNCDSFKDFEAFGEALNGMDLDF